MEITGESAGDGAFWAGSRPGAGTNQGVKAVLGVCRGVYANFLGLVRLPGDSPAL